MLPKISSMLDAVADSLEAKGLIKEAYEIDKIADELDIADKYDHFTDRRIPYVYYKEVIDVMKKEPSIANKAMWIKWYMTATVTNSYRIAEADYIARSNFKKGVKYKRSNPKLRVLDDKALSGKIYIANADYDDESKYDDDDAADRWIDRSVERHDEMLSDRMDKGLPIYGPH